MNEDENGQTPNEEPPQATPDILIKGDDKGEQEPSSAAQDIMQFGGEPPKAKQDIMMEMMTRADLKEAIKEPEEEREGSDGE